MTARRMRDVSHRNPTDPDNVFGRLFRRGPEAVADGGEPREETDEEREERMKDVDHTPPGEDAGHNDVWERGGEADEQVPGDE